MRIKQAIAPTMLVLLLGAVLVQLPFAIVARANDYEFFDPVIDIRSLLMDRFVEEPDPDAMQEAMISAMIDTLGDPHTVFIPPRYEESFNKDLRGTYVGIGAEVTMVDDFFTIISPMDGSPALEAGVMAGDVVLEIEGESTFQKPINACIDLLMGEPGTPVTITVRHLDDSEEKITITRGRIVARTVRGIRRLGEKWTFCLDEELGLYYLRVTQFNGSTVAELREVLSEIGHASIRGMLLDLRDNPGGELRAAVEMSDLFLERGVIVSVRDRQGEGPSFEASAPQTLPDFPMMVLVNSSSASASEIVSGALQANGRAKVFGTRSHGKGSVQEVRDLPLQRGTLKLTTAYYYVDSERSIHRRPGSVVWGVDPDAGMLMPVSDEDYIDKIRARREIEIIRVPEDDAEACAWPEWIRDVLKDDQLARALEMLQDRLSGLPWPAPDSEESSARVAVNEELTRALGARTARISQLNRLEERIAELQNMAEETGGEPLLPEDADLLAGTILLRDRDGNFVGEYRIDGGNVPLALEAIELTRVEN